MGCIAAGVIGAAAIGAGATAYSASSSSDAQGQAAQSAANSQNQANKLNYKEFQAARGAYGNAVLPDYMGNFESNLGTDLTNAYNSTAVPLTTFQSSVGQLKPAQANAVNFTNNLFNGGATSTMLTDNAPVQSARLVQANNAMTTARNSSLEALHQTLNSIDSQQAARGYVGDSYANRLLQFQAGQSAGTAIGQAQSGVDAASLQNAQDVANIKNYGNVTLPLQNINLPYTMAQQNAQFQFLPQDQYLQSIGQRIQPLNFLKIGYTGPFQYQPLPTPGPGAYSGTAGAAGAVGGAASGLAGTAMQYYMQNQQQQNLLNLLKNNSTSTAASTAYGAGATDNAAISGIEGTALNNGLTGVSPTLSTGAYGSSMLDAMVGGEE